MTTRGMKKQQSHRLSPEEKARLKALTAILSDTTMLIVGAFVRQWAPPRPSERVLSAMFRDLSDVVAGACCDGIMAAIEATKKEVKRK